MSMIGPYRLGGLLGRSPRAEVRRAVDTRTGRLLALKFLAVPLLDDAEARNRFRHEAQTLSGLRNPHLLPVHDAGEIDDRPFIAMPLVEGRNLRSLLDEYGAFPVQLALSIVNQVATALDTAHAAGVVHRDLQPESVLCAPAGHCYLIALGSARNPASSWSTDPRVAPGMLAYAAPERSSGDEDHRSDVYSLACVLFELLTGRQPFVTSRSAALVEAHRSAPPPRASASRPDIGAALDEVVVRGMHKDPALRHQTAGELAAAARAAASPAGRAGGRGVDGASDPRAPARADDLPTGAQQVSASRLADAIGRASAVTLVATAILLIALLALLAVAGLDLPLPWEQGR